MLDSFKMSNVFSWQNSVRFCLASFCTPRLNLPVTPGVSWRRQWHPTPVLLPGKSHGQRSLVGCSPWGHQESDTTEWLHFHFSLSYIREGNGNPLQCSCLENPRDRGASWAAIYGVTQSRTRLKWLSSSSSCGWDSRSLGQIQKILALYLWFWKCGPQPRSIITWEPVRNEDSQRPHPRLVS